ncbi:MAG: ChaN family lipoprotein [Undibacterium sp.]|nr:ChaN family lipoprotein [Undibacterium sp.]
MKIITAIGMVLISSALGVAGRVAAQNNVGLDASPSRDAIVWQSPEQRQHPLLGQILRADGSAIDAATLFTLLAQADYVFVGEKHDNLDHHQLEKILLQARLKARPDSAVVFEMLDDTQTAAITTLTAKDTLENIKTKLHWPEKGWDFVTYGPLFQLSLQKGKLVPGNLSKAFIGQLYMEGESLLKKDPRFQTHSMASETTRQHLLDRLVEAHCGMQSREGLKPMLTIQLAKDASMANALTAYSSGLLVAGGEHSRADTGVPVHVLHRKNTASTFVLQLVEVNAKDTQLAAYVESQGMADAYWFTPANSAKDYCADVKGKAAK